jgi:hypothetical protein
MRCDDARILQLAGEGGSDLSLHVRSCLRCAAAAAEILRTTAELEARLTTSVDEGAVDAVLARLAQAGRRDGPGTNSPPGARWRGSARASLWAPLGASLAVAAAAAGLLLVSRDPAPFPEGAPRVAATPAPPLVESSGAATLAIIQTDNPDITVLWFF